MIAYEVWPRNWRAAVGIVGARSREAARYASAKAAKDAGYSVAYADVRCRRRPDLDDHPELTRVPKVPLVFGRAARVLRGEPAGGAE